MPRKVYSMSAAIRSILQHRLAPFTTISVSNVVNIFYARSLRQDIELLINTTILANHPSCDAL